MRTHVAKVPIDLVPTTPRRHITGSLALNIPYVHRHSSGGLAPDRLVRHQAETARPALRDGRGGLRPTPRPPRLQRPPRCPPRTRDAAAPGRERDHALEAGAAGRVPASHGPVARSGLQAPERPAEAAQPDRPPRADLRAEPVRRPPAHPGRDRPDLARGADVDRAPQPRAPAPRRCALREGRALLWSRGPGVEPHPLAARTAAKFNGGRSAARAD